MSGGASAGSRMSTDMQKRFHAVAGAFDGNDFLIVAGLVLASLGVGLWSVPAALSLAGAGLFGLGLLGALRKAR